MSTGSGEVVASADMEEPMPLDASQMSTKHVADELEKRGLKASGFASEDISVLQKALNAEFERDREARMKRYAELQAARRAEEERLRLVRLMEAERKDEDEAVASDKRVSFWMDLVRSNATPAEMVWRIEPMAARALCKAVASNTSLRAIDICNAKLRDDVGITLGRVLATNTSLQRLDLDYNLLGPKSLAAIGEGLAANRASALSSLSLERNPLTGDSGKDVSGLRSFCALVIDSSLSPESASSESRLRSLNLYSTGLRSEGGSILARALSRNSTLTHLQVSPSDEIDTSDLAAITEALRKNADAADSLRAAEKAARAAARAADDSTRRVSAAAAAEFAEEGWVQAQRDARVAAWKRAEEETAKSELKAHLERLADEAERRARWKAAGIAEATAAAAAAKKKKK